MRKLSGIKTGVHRLSCISFDKTGCAKQGGQKAPLPVMEPGNHSSHSPVVTQREEGTTNPNLPPNDGVTSWSYSTHLQMDMTTVFLFILFESTGSDASVFVSNDMTTAPSVCQDSVNDMGCVASQKCRVTNCKSNKSL